MSIALQILKANGEIATPAARLSNAQATVIKAESGQRFQLIDEITGFAPENIEVQRAGNDLLVAFEGQTTEQPGLIIQDYYATAGNKTDNLLVGLHENGAIYPYVPETAQAGAAIHQLAEGVVATQAVGGSVATAAAMTLPLWPLALIPLAGLAALAGGGGGGGGGDDKPALPKASISGLEKVNEGVGTVEYTVTLDKPAAEDVTIKYTITPNAPTSVEDFTKNTPMTGTVTIPKGKTTATIPVGIENDDIYEGEESYTVKISDPTNATIGKDSVTTTIYDNGTTDGKTPGTDPVPSDPKIPHDSDDDRPTVSIEGPNSVNEGIGQAKYTIKLDKASGVDTEITYTVAHAADDPKTDDKDFGTNGAGTRTVIIKAGQTSAEISVDIENDKEYESANGGEKYTVSIDKAEGVKTENGETIKKELKYANKSVTTAIWDNGTTDGTTPGNNPPADPKNPDATPHDTDDDRPLSITGDGDEVEEGKEYKGTFTIGPKTSFTSITINGKELGLNKIINASNEFPIDLDPNSDKDGAINLKITGYNPETGELSYTYKSDAQDHSKNNPIINEIPFTLLGTDGNKHDGKFTVKITDTEPVAVDDENKANIESGSVLEKTASGNVLDNDETGEDTPITVIGAEAGVHDKVSNGVGTEIQGELGTLKIQADGSYTYTPNQGKTGKDVFTYTIKDADGTISTAKLTITVNSPADILTKTTNPTVNLDTASDLRYSSANLAATITDKDKDEHYLKAIGETEKLSNGNIISGAYGNFLVQEITAQDGNTSRYEFKYTLNENNTVIKALSKGLDLIIYDNLNIHSYDGMTANSYDSLSVAIHGKVKSIDFTSETTENDDIYQTGDVLDSTINTLAGNDVVVINSAKNATISLGEGNDYFYAKGNISNTSIQGGDGDDVITLYGTATNGSKINGGAGKDTLVLAQNTTIDGNELGITNIEVIDLRGGNGKDIMSMAPNTVTLTQSALVDNGVKNISVFANKTDASNKNPLDVFTLDVDDVSSVSRDGNVYTVNLGAQGTYTITDELNIGINIV